MKKIKIIELHGDEINGCGDDYYTTTIYQMAAFTDWEEVSEEDFEVLKAWVNAQSRHSLTKTIMIEEKDIDIAKTVSEYTQTAKEEKKRIEAVVHKQELRVKKREEAQEKKKAKLEAKKAAQEKELFEKLKAKYQALP